MNNDKFPLHTIADHFAKVLRTAPRLLGNDALNFFLDSFKRQGWQGATFQPWAARKNKTNNKGRAILVQSGRLRRSPRIISTTAETATIGTDVPYAQAHNEGFNGSVKQNVKAFDRKSAIGKIVAVRAHARTIQMSLPKRQFMGDSPVLTKQLINRLTNELMKAANNKA